MWFSEDDEHTYRLLVCLNRYLNPKSEFKLENRKEIIEVIRKLLNYNSNEKIQEEAKNILEMWG